MLLDIANRFMLVRRLLIKKVFVLATTTTLLNCLNAFTQNFNKQKTYLDALELQNIFTQEQNVKYSNDDRIDTFYQILNKYEIGKINISDNIFLKDLVLLPKASVGNNPYDSGLAINTPSSYHKLGLLPEAIQSASWQANIVNGLANFMAKRFKQEAMQMALNSLFKKILEPDSKNTFESIFPNTISQIKRLYNTGNNAYYSTDLMLLRQTAQLDLEKFPENTIKNIDVVLPALRENKAVKDMLLMGYYTVQYSKLQLSLPEIITAVANEQYVSGDSSAYNIINTIDLISQATLQPTFSESTWMNPTQLIVDFNSHSITYLRARFFYGLLYQQLKQIPAFNNYLTQNNNKEVIATKIKTLLQITNNLNSAYNYAKTKKFNLQSAEEIGTYLTSIIQIIQTFTENLHRIQNLNSNFNTSDTIINSTSKYLTLYEPLIKKEYQKIVPNFLIGFGNYTGASSKVLRIILFLSQLASIESSVDLENLLNAYALPIGSSSIKRSSSFNLSLNSYVGFTAGKEIAYGSLQNQGKPNIGLTTPIGISATFCKGLFTAFASILDLGSIVNQRLNNDTTTYSSLKFEHFFTPGLGLWYNIPKVPISFGLHYAYIPNLRTIKYEVNNALITEEHRSVSRINFSVLIDIPLFTLINKEK